MSDDGNLSDLLEDSNDASIGKPVSIKDIKEYFGISSGTPASRTNTARTKKSTSNKEDDDELLPTTEDEMEHYLEKHLMAKKRKMAMSEFIDDEAELSGDDDQSDDELDDSDSGEDLDLVDKEAADLDSEEEEEVRGLFHKQLESEDRRAVLLLQEHLEDRQAVGAGQGRRKKFRWQTKELMEFSLARHYNPDDDDSQDDDDDDYDDEDFDAMKPRLRRPTAEALMIGSTQLISRKNEPQAGPSHAYSGSASAYEPVAGCSKDYIEDDSNSNTMSSRLIAATARTHAAGDSSIARFLYRDKETVQALSTRETLTISREEKDRIVQRELNRVIQSKSIFDQLYS